MAFSISESPTRESVNVNVSPFDEAWKLLKTPEKVSDEVKLNEYLSELGITEASDLRDCEVVMVETLASYLKPIPKNAFLRIVKAAKAV